MKELTLSILFTLVASPIVAQSQSSFLDCAPLFGTYLNTKVDTSGSDPGIQGRTVLTLGASGTAMMTDSAQGGIANYQAFGMLHGPWTCSDSTEGAARFAVTLVDFSYPNTADPDGKVARVLVSGSVATDSGAIEGETTVYLYPLLDDPFSGAAVDPLVTYAFSGQKVPAP